MEATDLELARALLIANKEATLVAVRNDEVIVCTDRGIKPLLAWVREGRDLSGFSVADKIVGKAPALLYAILGPDAELRHPRAPHPEPYQERAVPHGLLRHQRLGAL